MQYKLYHNYLTLTVVKYIHIGNFASMKLRNNI